MSLAVGGMAELFVARKPGLAGFEKLVVIKRVLPNLARDPRLVERFLDEARLAARIAHSNVCHVHDLGSVGGEYFLAMEYLEGVTMVDLIKALARTRPANDLSLIGGLMGQACEGLHYAHELADHAGEPLGVVHRDVSPHNLFVCADGVLKVLDFGIAKARTAQAKTRTGFVQGKYAYMAPEQLRGRSVDRRVDVFALGVVLFEAVTGRRLFLRETEYDILRAIAKEPIPRARSIRPDIPESLDDL